MSTNAPDNRQFSPLGLKLVAAASLAGILVLIFPAALFLITGGIQKIVEASDALIPVSAAGGLCVPLFLSLRALKRGTLPEADSERILLFIWPLTVLAVGAAGLTVIIGALLVVMTLL